MTEAETEEMQKEIQKQIKETYARMNEGKGKNNFGAKHRKEKRELASQKMQEEMEAKEYEATVGGGMVSARVNGKHEVLSLSINPEAVDPDDVEMLQDMVVAAANEALRKAEAEQAANMSKLTGGLNLGGLF